MPGTRDRRTRHRSAPRRSLRLSFVLPFAVPAVLLTGVWGYTAAGLVEDQIQLQTDADRAASVAGPAQGLVSRAQDERLATAVWQASRSDDARSDLDAARKKTDTAVAQLRRSAASALDTSALRGRYEKLDEALDVLSDRRQAVDGRTLSTSAAFQYFTSTITAGTDLLGRAVRSDDGGPSHAGTATVSLVRVTEMLSREDALLRGALPARRISTADRALFGQYVAVQRETRTGLVPGDLPADGGTDFLGITGTSQWTALGRTENAVVAGRDTALPGQVSAWPRAAGNVVGALQSLGSDSLRRLSDSGSDKADDLLLGVALGSVATLAALVGGAVLALRARRSTLGSLDALRQRTEELADNWLPELLARIEGGEQVDPAAFAPPGRHATNEMERLASAIDRLGLVAAETAVRQSLGREGTEKVFAQLIRRTQILVHRLISLLDDLERKHEDSDLLKDIFKVDHLATRVRRHAENLVILSGSPPSRRMTAPVSITDVMRSAVAETEQYTRVKVKTLPVDKQLALTGRAVADVTHLLAELIENGTSFSPPDTQVYVGATRVAKGLAIHVEDHGLGIPEEQIAAANELLAHPPRLDMTALGEDPRLGHFVVARLAERHKIKVELRESVYGGTQVIVLLPQALLEEHDNPVLEQLRAAAVASGPELAAAEPPVREAVGAGVGGSVAGAPGAGAGLGGGGGFVGAETATHTRVPDYSGFPEYGGAGLLPAPPGGPAVAQMPLSHPVDRGPRAAERAPAGPEFAPATGYAPPPASASASASAGARGGGGHGGRGDHGGRGGMSGTGAAGAAGAAGGPVGVGGRSGASGGRPGAQGDRGAGSPVRHGPGNDFGGRERGPGNDFGDPERGPESGPGDGRGGPGGGRPRSETAFGTGTVGNGSGIGTGGPAPEAGGPGPESPRLSTPQVLPQRRRGASLAQQLRKEHAAGRHEDEGGGLSPDAAARAMSAIQRGLKRARIDDGDEPGGTDGEQERSPGPGGNQL